MRSILNKFFNFSLIVYFTLLFIILSSFLLYATSTGVTGKTRKGPDPGCTCHGSSPTSSVEVSISGPNSLSPGQKATYRVSISGGPLVRAGVNIASSSGTLSPIGSDLQKIGDELTHTSPKAPVGGVVTFDFEFTAPNTPGPITLYAVGNSVNYDGSNSGDAWNFAPDFRIDVVTLVENKESEIPKTFAVYQNYPNPFNPTTQIAFDLPESGNVKVEIFNSLGEKVAVLYDGFMEAGFGRSIRWNADGLSSGVYFYKVSLNDRYVDVKKMVLVK